MIIQPPLKAFKRKRKKKNIWSDGEMTTSKSILKVEKKLDWRSQDRH